MGDREQWKINIPSKVSHGQHKRNQQQQGWNRDGKSQQDRKKRDNSNQRHGINIILLDFSMTLDSMRHERLLYKQAIEMSGFLLQRRYYLISHEQQRVSLTANHQDQGFSWFYMRTSVIRNGNVITINSWILLADGCIVSTEFQMCFLFEDCKVDDN